MRNVCMLNLFYATIVNLTPTLPGGGGSFKRVLPGCFINKIKSYYPENDNLKCQKSCTDGQSE